MRVILAGAILAAAVLSAGAQEHGRAALNPEGNAAGLGRAPLPVARYDGFVSGGAAGVKVALGWANVDWSLGPADGTESLFAPQVSLFYKATDSLDVNVSTVFLSAKDTDDELGDTEADLMRLAVGVRYWVNTQTRVTPYMGAGLGYYLVDGKTEKTREDGRVVSADVSVKDTPGAFLEGGVAFLVGDDFYINTELTYDFLLGSADATINGHDESFDVKSLSFNLGVTWIF